MENEIVDTLPEPEEPPEILYGVWLPGIGWLKVESEPVAFRILEIAKSTAERIGQGAKVEFIDFSLVGLENKLLEAEKLEEEKLLEMKKALSESNNNWLKRILSKITGEK